MWITIGSGGIGRNGIRSGSPSQPLQSQAVKPRITTPPSKEKTALGRAASASTYSPKKLDMNSKKADKEVSLTKSATAKSVKVQGDSVAIGRLKQNQSVKLHATRELVAGDNSCLSTSSDMLTSSKPGQLPVSTWFVLYGFVFVSWRILSNGKNCAFQVMEVNKTVDALEGKVSVVMMNGL
jgi:hypothetical protein